MTVDAAPRDILANARVVSGLSPAHREILLGCMGPLKLNAGDYLCVQGELGDSMAILIQGRCEVTLLKPDGTSATIGVLTPGSVIGEMSCLDPARRSATVVATEPCTILTLTRQALEDLRVSVPAVAAAIVSGTVEELAQRLRDTNLRIQAVSHGENGAPPLAPHLNEASPPRGGPLPEGVLIDLQRIPLLKGMTHRDLDLLTSVAPPMAFEDGTLLCKEGTVGSACYLLLDGEVEVLKGEGDDEEILATLKPRTLVGQLSLIDKAPRSATVRANGAIIAQQLHRDVFERLLAAASPLGLRFQQQLAIAGIRQLRMANEVLTTLLAKRPPESQRLIYVQAALSEWTLPLEELEEVSGLIEVEPDEDTADLTELFNFEELTDVPPPSRQTHKPT